MWSSVPSWYVSWLLSDKCITIHLYLHVVDWLNQEVRRSLKSPAEQREVSGILLGRTELGAHRQITIEGLSPLSGNRTLAELVAQSKFAADKRMYAIGYYLCYDRDDSHFGVTNQTIANEYFADAGSIVLLIKQLTVDITVGGFFLREDYCRSPPQARLLFPLNRFKLMNGETTITGMSVDEMRPSAGQDAASEIHWDEGKPFSDERPFFSTKDTVDKERPLFQPTAPTHEAAGATCRSRLRLALLMGILCLALVAAGMTLRKPSAAGKHTELALNLRVERARDFLRLRWNNTAPIINSTAKGVLQIRDGILEKDVILNSDELRSASFLYPSLTDDVIFRLNVVSAGRVATESALVAGTSSSGRFSPPGPLPLRQIDPEPLRQRTTP